VKLVHLVGFITKKFVTMHGHMNVKFQLDTFGHSLVTFCLLGKIIFFQGHFLHLGYTGIECFTRENIDCVGLWIGL